jgi:hypothetical protein
MITRPTTTVWICSFDTLTRIRSPEASRMCRPTSCPIGDSAGGPGQLQVRRSNTAPLGDTTERSVDERLTHARCGRVDAVLVVDLAQLKCPSMLSVRSPIGPSQSWFHRVRLSCRPAFVPRATGRRQESSRTAGSNPSAGQGPDRCIAAGSEPGLENTLKVETRVRTPLGLRRQTCRSQAKFGATSAMNRRLLARLIRKYPAAAQRSPSAPYVWLCRTVPIASRPVPSSPSTCGQGAVSPPAEGGVTPISLTSRGNAFG